MRPPPPPPHLLPLSDEIQRKHIPIIWVNHDGAINDVHSGLPVLCTLDVSDESSNYRTLHDIDVRPPACTKHVWGLSQGLWEDGWPTKGRWLMCLSGQRDAPRRSKIYHNRLFSNYAYSYIFQCYFLWNRSWSRIASLTNMTSLMIFAHYTKDCTIKGKLDWVMLKSPGSVIGNLQTVVYSRTHSLQNKSAAWCLYVWEPTSALLANWSIGNKNLTPLVT